MSGEEMIESNAEVVESTESTESIENIETLETSEAEASEVNLSNVHEMSDDELNEFIASDIPTGFDSEDDQEFPSESSEQAEPVEEGEDEDVSAEGVNYEQIYQELFGTPFKASGQEIQIDTPEEAKRLIQQGFDYSKKMGDFAPYKKAMTVLKNRGALDPEKLDFLLDVSEGKPEAIAKLLKDQNLDPYEIDVDSGDNYESEYEDTESSNEILDMLDRVSSSAKNTTLNILTESETSWDEKSRQAIIANAAQAVPVLTKQMESGHFDLIMSAVTKQRALGNIPSHIGDLDAYNMVGKDLAEQGKLGVPNTPTESTTSKPNLKQKQNVQSKRQKAAGSPRKAPSNVPTAETFNPATASDAEVEKFWQNHIRNAAG